MWTRGRRRTSLQPTVQDVTSRSDASSRRILRLKTTGLKESPTPTTIASSTWLKICRTAASLKTSLKSASGDLTSSNTKYPLTNKFKSNQLKKRLPRTPRVTPPKQWQNKSERTVYSLKIITISKFISN